MYIFNIYNTTKYRRMNTKFKIRKEIKKERVKILTRRPCHKSLNVRRQSQGRHIMWLGAPPTIYKLHPSLILAAVFLSFMNEIFILTLYIFFFKWHKHLNEFQCTVGTRGWHFTSSLTVYNKTTQSCFRNENGYSNFIISTHRYWH